jgi:hypothetical protein
MFCFNSYFKDLAKKAGFVVYNKLEDFKDSQLKMRIILCYNHSEDEKNEQKLLPDDKLIKGKKLIFYCVLKL